MDQPSQFENPESGKSEEGDIATHRIDSSGLDIDLEKETQAGGEAATELITRKEDPAATKVITAVQGDLPAIPESVEPPKPTISPAQPAAFSSTTAPQKDNRTPIVAIIAVAVVALVCICACTAIMITALMVIPTL